MEVAAGSMVGLKEHVGVHALLQADRRTGRFCFVEEEEEEKESSSESSSIGAPSSSEEDDEVQSQLKKSPLGSLDSLEDSLPIKRGLSNFFAGKSKSYASLSEAASSGELAKPESPLNKRRRILMACKASSSSWSRRASCGSLLHPLPPVDEDDGDGDDDGDPPPPSPSKSTLFFPAPVVIIHRKEDKDFKSARSFSLSDLPRHA